MDADAAGILGLLLGGAGGYYGGKKRAEREASDLEKLIALYGGEGDKKSEEDDVEEALNNIAQNETESLYNKDGVRKNFLVDALKNTQFGSTAGTYDDPFAKYIRDDAEAINSPLDVPRTKVLNPLMYLIALTWSEPIVNFIPSLAFVPVVKFSKSPD